MSLVVVVLLSPSLCRLHHTFCIPAPCSPSSNSHILSLLGIVTVICVSPYPMHSPAQLLYCRYKHTPPPGLLRSAMLLLSYLTPLVTLNANVILCCTLCVDQAGPCLSHPCLCSVFALQDCPRSPNSSCTISHTCVQPSQSRAAHRVHTLSYLSCPYLCSALTSWHGCPPIQSTLPT